MTGGRGGSVGGTGATPGGAGGNGIDADGARVVLYDVTTTGGGGGVGSWMYGAAGHGLHVRNAATPGQLMASNSTFQGGAGSYAEDLGHWGPYGNGGSGLWTGAGTLAWQLDCAYVGGPPSPYFGGSSPPAQPGQGLVNQGTVSTFQVSKVVLSGPAIVRENTLMSFTFTADPGDEIFLVRAKKASFLGLASWRGFFLAKPTGLNLDEVVPTPIVTIPGSGQATIAVRAPEIAPATNGRTVYFQAYRKTAAGAITLGSFLPLTVVGAGY